jgi:hypothetical protein
MTETGWVSYSGTAAIVLAVILAAAAAAVAYAGIKLPLPVRLPRSGATAKIVILAAWVAAIVAFLASVAVYLAQVYRDGLEHARPADPITPVTFLGAFAVFLTIAIVQRGRGWRFALGSAAVGAMAGPMIFELPFDLIIMVRGHVAVDPALYRPLLFGTLILVDIMTLALLWLSPAARLHRVTLWCFAGMLAVFAGWALLGFGYPSAPGPIALNALSKILALATGLTLFLPVRSRPRTPQRAPEAAVSVPAGVSS